MTFEAHLKRLRVQRQKQSNAERATITVRREDMPDYTESFTGSVLIDGHRLGYLVGGESTTFDIEPGVHAVKVTLLGRRKPTVPSGKAVASTSVSIGDREN